MLTVYIVNACTCFQENQVFFSTRTTFYQYQDCEKEIRQFFMFQDKSSLVYCNNIAGLIKLMGFEYDTTEWKLFIDTFNRSLKTVLLPNGNSFSSIPTQYK